MKSSAIFSAFIFVLFLCFTALPAQARTSHQQNSSPAYSQSVQKHHHKASVKHRHSSRHHSAARTSNARRHHASRTSHSASALRNAGDRTNGLAAWYGGKDHHQKMTSSGERFDHHAMTAAHRTLPFGSLVKVTNLRNNKSVVVRITDRGLFLQAFHRSQQRRGPENRYARGRHRSCEHGTRQSGQRLIPPASHTGRGLPKYTFS